jgi:hypothetical protein
MPSPLTPPTPQAGIDPIQTNSLSATGPLAGLAGGLPALPVYNIFEDDAKLIEIAKKVKDDCLEHRWLWERDWLRDQHYTSGRQWITYNTSRREWVDKRLHKWIPKPVTNKIAETVQAIRTTFGAIDLAVKVRPVGSDPKSVSAAEVADAMAPLIHEEHLMNQVMREVDYWLITSGSGLLQVIWERDKRFNTSFIQHEQCLRCGQVFPPKAIADNFHTCPTPMCGGKEFDWAQNPDGTPVGEEISFGRGKTIARSPFEYGFPAHVTRFDEVPHLVVMRWREKSYFLANYPELVPKISWEKSPSDRSMQIFKSLALSNELGLGTAPATFGTAGTPSSEGVTEFEVWIKPTADFPQGAVIRLIGDKNPLLLKSPSENVPGPFPLKDVAGKVIFPFAFSQYEHIGGRLWGRSALSIIIQKQDQLNQLDSLAQLIIQRMANPVWVIPEGAGIDQFSGEPGFVMKWNPLSVGGAQAKPERIAGADIPSSFITLREQILNDMENLTGTYDIIKGQKPQGVEAFSALQLLVERSQSRFQSVFASRGEMYRRWFEIAIEMERQYGPDERVMTVIGPNKQYAFEHFLNAQLQGAVKVQIEDGSNMPKTSLGKRAAIEQASQLQLLNPADPDQSYALLSQFGLVDLVPSLNIHVQSALQMQDDFEKWMLTPEASQPAIDPMTGQPAMQVDPMTGMATPALPQSPLMVRPWLKPDVHFNERVKWLNTDKMRDAMAENPMIEQIIMAHLNELQMALMPPPQVGPDGQPVADGGLAMANSNQNSGSTGSMPKGNQENGPRMGPT